jgi:hypothetical protein
MSKNPSAAMKPTRIVTARNWNVAHALLAITLNITLSFVIYHAFDARVLPGIAAMRTLLPWTIGLNLLSTALIISFCRWADWLNARLAVMLFDCATASLPLLILTAVGRVHLFGLIYTLFVFSKAGVLVLYAVANCNRVTDLRFARFWVLATSFAVYAGITPWVALAAWPNGDEPAYLTLTHSLLTDHDFDVANNYQRLDYRSFFPPSLPGDDEGYPRSAREHDTLVAITQQHHTVPGRHHDELLWHDVGMPLLILPGYAIAGRLGAMLELDFLAALLALGCYELAVELGATPPAALLAWSLFAFTSPILVYSSQIFPEMLGGAFAVFALLTFTKSLKNSRSSQFLVIGVFIAVLPWLCIRYWMLVVALIAVVGCRIVVSTSSRVAMLKNLCILAAPLLVSLALFAWFDKQHFNTVIPNAGYLLIVSVQPQFGLRPDIGFLGLFFDRAYGLLPFAPNYLIALAGVPAAWRRNRWVTAAIVLPSSTYILFMVFSRFWFAGWAPAGRYLVTGVVLWIPLAALVLDQSRGRYVVLLFSAWTLLLSVGHAAFPLTRYPSLRDHTKGALAQFSNQIVGQDYSRIFPSLIRATSGDLQLAAVWALAAAWFIWFLSRRAPSYSK